MILKRFSSPHLSGRNFRMRVFSPFRCKWHIAPVPATDGLHGDMRHLIWSVIGLVTVHYLTYYPMSGWLTLQHHVRHSSIRIQRTVDRRAREIIQLDERTHRESIGDRALARDPGRDNYKISNKQVVSTCKSQPNAVHL